MMYKNKSGFGLAFLTMTAISTNAGAAIIGPATIRFSGLHTALFGTSNLEPQANGNCPVSATCYYERGMTIGVVDDPVGRGEHLHSTGSLAALKLQYHADSSGIYIRATDGTAFSLNQMQFFAPLNGDNPGYDAINNPLVAGDFWEILGFNAAANPDLSSGDGTHYATRVAYQQVANGFNGDLMLDPAFQNINAFWIHFNGYTGVPQDGVYFGMSLDNVLVAAPVPIPTAAWLMLTGLMGVLGIGKRRKALAT